MRPANGWRRLAIAASALAIVWSGSAFAGFFDDAQRLIEGARQTQESAPAVQTAERSPGDDDHFIQQDDYFISDEPFARQDYIYVKIAKMVTQPSAATKQQAEFFQVNGGNNVWSKNYYRTRIAAGGDLKLGTKVIVFDSHAVDGIYMAPETKESARNGAWWIAKITDTSDLFKHYVTVSGGYRVHEKNLRVLK